MKVLLIVGGVLFLLLSLALLIGAAVAFFVARSRKAASPPAAGTPPPPAPVVDPNATVVVDLRGPAPRWGALHGVSGPVAGAVFPIDGAGYYIGRDRAHAQVIVESPMISKRHLWIGVKDGAVVAIDQNSTNGTFLNTPGSGITEVRLKPGDTLILADDTARLTYKV
jgi:hypothetical protein